MDEAIWKREKMLREEGYKPRILAVDEFATHKGHSYATCVMDLEQGVILWVGKGRAIIKCQDPMYKKYYIKMYN